MISQGISHTAYDVMREYMITGAELDGKYQIPMMERYTDRPGEDTVDFKDSFSPKIKNHRKLTVNFYIDRKSTRLNSSHSRKSRMPSSA